MHLKRYPDFDVSLHRNQNFKEIHFENWKERRKEGSNFKFQGRITTLKFH